MRLLKRYIFSIIAIVKSFRQQATVPKIFTKLVAKHPNKVAFYYEDEIWTFQDVDKFSNKVAHFFKKEGYKRGDNIALLLENGPEYVCIWLGLAKIGVVTALINNNISGNSLVHSIKAIEPKAVIYGSSFKNVIRNVSGEILNLKLCELSNKTTKSCFIDFFITDLRKELEIQPDVSLNREDIEAGKPQDCLIYIYTSGTTGLPKAVTVKNLKFFMLPQTIRCLALLNKDEIMYNPLPLYHSMGGILGVGQCLINGSSVVLKKHFSATNFWKDCIKYKCTLVLYIGETCRYVLAHHINDDGPNIHSVKKFIGSGLKPQIWDQFVSRFNIKHVYEIFGSTEGNTNLLNIEGKAGAIGYMPFWGKLIYPLCLVKCNLATAEPIRGSDGFCQQCEINEPGLVIGKVSIGTTMIEFAGYTDKKATEKKLLKDVFKKGDVYFNSGDILSMDELRYFYFVDRTGDTFRWKGENVSTAEVEAIISNILDLKDAVVYGVKIPNTDGRAGMAAIVCDLATLNMNKFCQRLKENLPPFAIPVFLRIVEEISLTATFKIKKVQLQKEGFDVGTIKDKILVYDDKNVTYVEVTKERYNDIIEGKIRL